MKTERRESSARWWWRVAAGAALLACLVAGLSWVGGCTKKVKSHRGVYSPEQLPEETDTPILDALFPDDDKR